MKSATRTSSIPQEIIVEIFSWLPIESLMRFKCVSKFCNFLVSELDFVDIQQCRSMTRTSGIKFLVYQRTKLYTTEEGKVPHLHIDNFCENVLFDWIMCTNGLFCCSMTSEDCVAICNPCTKVVR